MTIFLLSHENQICPFCRSSLSGDEIIRCHSCGTAHHKICWTGHHRCSVFGCSHSLHRKHLFTFQIMAGVLMIPLFVLLIFSVITFSAASVEFGLHAGYQVIQSSMAVPVALLTFLLFCGLYTFYVELSKDNNDSRN